MRIPTVFYSTPTTSRVKYTQNPPGDLSVDRLAKGKPAWSSHAQSRELKPKKLILADWGANNWSSEKIAEVKHAITQLIDDGFSIYIWQAGVVKPLHKSELSVLDLGEVRGAMIPEYPDEIRRRALAMPDEHLVVDELQVIDNYWMQQLLNDSIDPQSYILNVDDFAHVGAQDHEKLVKILKGTVPAVSQIYHDHFFKQSNLVRRYLVKQFNQSNIEFKTVYETVILGAHDLSRLAHEETVNIDGEPLTFSELGQMRVLVLLSSGDGNIFLPEGSLPNVQHLVLFRSKLSSSDLQTLLLATPNLKILNLNKSRGLSGDLRLAAGSLAHLEGLYLDGSTITNNGLQQLLIASPHVKILHFPRYTTVIRDFKLAAQSLPELTKINLDSGAVKSDGLQQLLAASINLQQLSLVACKLSGELILDVGSLAQLEELVLDNSNITRESLRQFISAAPNLKRLTLLNTNSLVIDEELLRLLASIPEVSYPVEQESLVQAQVVSAELVEVSPVESPVDAPINSLHRHEHTPVANRESISRPVLEDFPAYNASDAKYITPTQENAAFEFRGINKTKNQSMIVEKLSQYLTLNAQHLEEIPHLQDGICDVLVHYFIGCSSDDWNQFLVEASQWDGRFATQTADLIKYFNELITCYNFLTKTKFKLDPSIKMFLGDNLAPFLASCDKPCILRNPWHAIAIRPNGSEWDIYDPNLATGVKTVHRDELLDTVHRMIGKLVLVDSTDATLSPGIENPSAFFAEGGLLALCKCDNPLAMLQLLRSIPEYSLEALAGLLSRDVDGVPSWVKGLKKSVSEISIYTWELLRQFMAKNPDNFTEQLQTSIALLTSAQKQECITQIIQKIPESEERNQLIELIRFTPTAVSQYEQQLKTWHKPTPELKSPLAYLQHCVEPNEIKKSLIELSSTREVDGMRWALQKHCQETSRPVFYVHSPDDLVCSAPFVERQKDNSGILRKGPGGALHDFLKANSEGQAPVLIVNYEQFSAEDIVRFNALLDKERRADGSLLPQDAVIVGLINVNKPDCYQGSDFYSRFDRVEACPLPAAQLEAAIPVVPVQKKQVDSPIVNHVINLYHASDWQERLLGRWVLNQDKLTFEEGQLQQALLSGACIEIQNGLWEDDDFQRFWQEARQRGFIENDGRRISVPANLQLLRSDGYDWETLSHVITATEEANSNAVVLNPSCFGEFFNRYHCDNSNKTIESLPGLIKETTGKTLTVQLTRALDEDSWAQLLATCHQHQVRLAVQCAPNVQLPQVLQISLIAQAPPLVNEVWNSKHIPQGATQIIASTDTDTTVAQVSAGLDWIVIDVSECKAADLLRRMDGKLNENKLCFEFSEKMCAVLRALEDRKNVILKGHFSAELVDELMPLLLARLGSKNALGKLLLVSDDAAPFNAVPVYDHKVTYEEKRASLAGTRPEILQRLEPFLEKESLSKLKARRDFFLAHPKAVSSDDAWLGLQDLPGLVQPLDELDPERSKPMTADFMVARRRAVNAVLNRSPCVFLAGLSGVGKSTFVENELWQGTDVLYVGENALKQWATHTKTPPTCRKILFLDEANLSNRQWSEFEGLFQDPPGITIEGVFYRLTPGHKVVFAGNPISYGDERQLAPFFQRHGGAVVFNPIPANVVYESILKPVFENTLLQDKAPEISRHILKVYRFLCECSTTDVLISPRELQMMALLVSTYHRHHPEVDLTAITEHFAYDIARNLVPASKLAAFDTQFKPSKPLLVNEIEENAQFLITPSRQPTVQLIKNLLDLRNHRRTSDANDAQQYGGLGGIILEGKPAAGKSELVIAILTSNGYEEEHDFINPSSREKPFYRMPVSMSLVEKEVLLLKAFHEGAVVVIDEINSSPMMEKLLNSLLMGKTPDNKRPDKPGFMVIGTQNPISMAGRRAPSTALARRLITVNLPDYQREEIQSILVHKGLPSAEAKPLAVAYERGVAYAVQHHLGPIPTLRDVLKLVVQVLKRLPTLVAKKKAELKQTQVVHSGKAEKLVSSGGFFGHTASTAQGRKEQLAAVDGKVNKPDFK